MEEIKDLEKLALPYGKEVQFQEIQYDNGFRMLRLRFREGKRFTMIDLDPDTVKSWIHTLETWLENSPGD